MQKTIESIQKQTFTDFEVWIIDGKSSQETQDYLKKLAYPFQFISENDLGIYDAMNKGISLSKGEWLYFLGAGDCLSNSSILSKIINHLNPNIDFFFGNISYGKNIFYSNFSKMMWFKNTLHHQAVFYHKRIFKENKYDLSYKILADYDLNLKLLQKKVFSKKVDEIFAFCDENGLSKNYTLQLYKEELLLKKRKLSLFYYPLLYILFGIKYFFKGVLKI